MNFYEVRVGANKLIVKVEFGPEIFQIINISNCSLIVNVPKGTYSLLNMDLQHNAAQHKPLAPLSHLSENKVNITFK